MILIGLPQDVDSKWIKKLDSVLQDEPHVFLAEADGQSWQNETINNLLEQAQRHDPLIEQYAPKISPVSDAESKEKNEETETPSSQDETRPIVLYVSGMNREGISALYQKLEQAGFDNIQMSMETEQNLQWTWKALCEELEREATYFARREELASLVSNADRMRLAMDQDYRSCMMLAANLLREEDLSEKMLDTALDVIRSLG